MFDNQKKKKNGQSRRRWWHLLLVVVIIIIGIGFVCNIILIPNVDTILKVPRINDIFADVTTESFGVEAQSHIENTLKIILSDSVQEAYYYSTTWQDYIMQLRLDLPSENISVFLDSISHLCFDMSLQDDIMQFTSVDVFMDWWQPEQAEKFITVPECSENPLWHLLIDQSDDDIWIVYIEAIIE